MKSTKRIRYVTHAAIIAALYTVLTYVSFALSLSSGAVQCRLSEALCILPAFTPAAVPGLFIGCFISNLLTGSIFLDVVFGSLATLIGAIGTRILAGKGANKYFITLPPIISNAVVIPLVLKFAYGLEAHIIYFVATVLAGEIISCGILGTVCYYSLLKHKSSLFGKM